MASIQAHAQANGNGNVGSAAYKLLRPRFELFSRYQRDAHPFGDAFYDEGVCPRCKGPARWVSEDPECLCKPPANPTVWGGPCDPIGMLHALLHWEPLDSLDQLEFQTGRYDGRHVDLDQLLAQPPRPTPWRVQNFVADGTLTVLAGEAAAGKSWLGQAFCTGVGNGEAVAGLSCSKGTALYVDGEMGPQMFVDQRLRPAGIATSVPFEYIDAMGLDFSTGSDTLWLRQIIEGVRAELVVIDSLRRLMPSKAENASDDMAPVIASLAKLARDTAAAIVLVHHKGDGDKWFRGSTAIKDQADALFGLLRTTTDEDEDDPVRRLRCRGGKGKMRYAPEPPDIWLAISPTHGGVVAVDPPDQFERMAKEGRSAIRESVKEQILEALPVQRKAHAAAACHPPRERNDPTFNAVWRELEHAGRIEKVGKEFVVSNPEPLGGDDLDDISATTLFGL
jgi:archaellum biogenesis ATPase FlaH